MVTSGSIPSHITNSEQDIWTFHYFQFYFLLIFWYEMTPFRGIIKITIELVPILAGSRQDVNKMLGPGEQILK